jgi:serine protease Do
LQWAALATTLGAAQWALGDVPPNPRPACPAAAPRATQTRLVGEGDIVRGWLGFAVRDFTPPEPNPFHLITVHGVLVRGVQAGSPAATAGLKPGDVMLRFDHRPVTTADALRSAVIGTAPGTKVDFTVFRDGKEQELSARVGRLDDRLLVVASPKPVSDELGLTVGNLSPAKARGVIVRTVSADSLAADAGLRPNDVIVSVQGKPVSSVGQYSAVLAHRDLLTTGVHLAIRSSGATERDVYLARTAG